MVVMDKDVVTFIQNSRTTPLASIGKEFGEVKIEYGNF